MSLEDIAKAAKSAFEESQLFPSSERIKALTAIRRQLVEYKTKVFAANAEDLQVRFPVLNFMDEFKSVGCSSRSRCGTDARVTTEATGSLSRR